MRGTRFQLTTFEVERWAEIREELETSMYPEYAIAGQENCPTTGRSHLHIYIVFGTTKSITRFARKYKAHIERCGGNHQSNVQYVTKEGATKMFEIGIVPDRTIVKTVRELRDADVNGINPFLFRIKKDLDREKAGVFSGENVYKNLHVYYIHGPSGIGKTKKAIEMMGELEFNIVKFANNFWLGISDYPVKQCIYDDFRDSQIPASEFVMFIDYNKHSLNIKGGSRINEYTMIVITSVQDPETIYSHVGDEPRRQWLRRMCVIDLGLEQVMEQLPP